MLLHPSTNIAGSSFVLCGILCGISGRERRNRRRIRPKKKLKAVMLLSQRWGEPRAPRVHPCGGSVLRLENRGPKTREESSLDWTTGPRFDRPFCHQCDYSRRAKNPICRMRHSTTRPRILGGGWRSVTYQISSPICSSHESIRSKRQGCFPSDPITLFHRLLLNPLVRVGIQT
ncbi:hypothetical protein H4582DRAFT_1393384 [Lactarius indigo]|nr:hypothetical protein H4582DRAFT_1393384 [Lactarius indigo]